MRFRLGIQRKKFFMFCCMFIITIIGNYAIIWAKNKNKIKIQYKADKLEGSEKENKLDSYKQLVGNVVFVHEGFTIYADSVQYYDKKSYLTANGNLKMTDAEGGVMMAERLEYDINKKIAKIRDAVSYEQDTMSFYTEALDYEVKEKRVYFNNGGSLTQNMDQLNSQSGYYDEKNKLAVFYNAVELSSEEYYAKCDTLHYYTTSKLAEFKGNTEISTKEGETLVTQEGGQYNTETTEGIFKKAKLETSKYSMYGNLIKANKKKKSYSASGQVELISKEHKATITAAYSDYNYDTGIAEIYGSPLLKRIMEEDTLYMVADTIRAIENKRDTDKGNTDQVILAYNNVKIYKSNLQCKADSMAYHSIDSTIRFYHNPIFWSHDNQITGESISLVIKEESIEKMYIHVNAFITSLDTLGNYNQVKGREMVSYFQDNKIDYIDILGNGESLYFVAGDSSNLVGMNYIRCSHMRIDMVDEVLSKISFMVQPTGVFYPAHKIVETEQRLPNFDWRIDEKPVIEDFLSRERLFIK